MFRLQSIAVLWCPGSSLGPACRVWATIGHTLAATATWLWRENTHEYKSLRELFLVFWDYTFVGLGRTRSCVNIISFPSLYGLLMGPPPRQGIPLPLRTGRPLWASTSPAPFWVLSHMCLLPRNPPTILHQKGEGRGVNPWWGHAVISWSVWSRSFCGSKQACAPWLSLLRNVHTFPKPIR